MMRAGKEMCGTRCRGVCVCRRPVQFSPRRRPILIGDADAFAAAVRQGFELVLWVVEAFCRPRPAPLLDGIDVPATAPNGRKQGEHNEARLNCGPSGGGGPAARRASAPARHQQMLQDPRTKPATSMLCLLTLPDWTNPAFNFKESQVIPRN